MFIPSFFATLNYVRTETLSFSVELSKDLRRTFYLRATCDE